jgi:hypothetical protein
MTRTVLATCTLLLFSTLLLSQEDTTKAWELPMREGIICFDYSHEFTNTKKELCSYYTDMKLLQEVNSKVAAELSGKGNKVLSNTSYSMTCQLWGADMNASNLQSVFPTCDPTKSDTVWGKLTIIMGKTSMSLTAPGGAKKTFSTVTCSFRVIFTGNNKYEISYRGFMLSVMCNGVMTQVPLEDTYNEFAKGEKKKKSEIEFYQDITELINVFHSALTDQLARNIKIAEMK